MIDWNDLRFVLSVARHQTLSGAGRVLGVNQTTVARRLQSIEAALETRLFDRIDQRWIPTDAGAIAVRHAERMEADALDTATEVAGKDQSVAGKVRLTSVPVVINCLLAPRVSELLDSFPEIELELIDSQENLNLAHREADLAIRLARPTLPSAVTRRIGTLNSHVYVAKKYADRVDELPWIAFSEAKRRLPVEQWLLKQLGDKKPLLRVSDTNVMVSVVENMPCRAVIPAACVRADSGLVNVSGPIPVVKRDVWLVYMKAMRRNARVAAVAGWATEICRAALK